MTDSKFRELVREMRIRQGMVRRAELRPESISQFDRKLEAQAVLDLEASQHELQKLAAAIDRELGLLPSEV